MALITKILETTLAAGATSVTFNDADIPNSLIRVFATNSNIYPLNISLSGNILTVTYEAQDSAMGVALEISKQGLEIVDGVSSTAADKALSANQGKLLNDDITTVSGDLSDLSTTVAGLVIPDEITDLSDVNVTSIQDGQVLAWNSMTEKFENVDQSGGSSINYSTDEQVIGTWIDGSTLYRKTFDIGNLLNNGTKTYPLNISNLKYVVNWSGTCYSTISDGYCRPIPLSDPTAANTIRLDVGGGYINIKTASDWSAYKAFVTLDYIKTV